MYLRLLVLIFLALMMGFRPSIAQGRFNFSDSTKVSLLTCSPGDELYSTFGHSAVRVNDPLSGIDAVFNWGIFDFNTPNFYWKFMTGKLLYQMGGQNWSSFLEEYKMIQRAVVETPIHLPLEAKRKLLVTIEDNYLPENRKYKYDFFFDNCATRIRDVVERALPIQYVDTARTIKPLRRLLDEYLSNMPWSDFGIDLILGLPTDQVGTFRYEMFLPDYLGKNLPHARYRGQAITGPEVEILAATPLPPFKGPKPLPVMSIVMLAWVALGFLKLPKLVRILDRFFFFLIGFAGCLMLFLWFGTDHLATKDNLNVLWANPLYFFALGSLKGKRKVWLWIVGGLCVFTLAFFPFSPQLLHPAIIPILIAVAIRSFKIARFGV
jgi:Domain of unknown function (DUF4105)